jgi:hypothetical protein
MVTVNRFWQAEGETGRQTDRTHLGAFASVRDMARLDFFGIGPDTFRADRTDFRLRETEIGARAWAHASRAWRVGGQAEIYSPQLGSGTSPAVVSIEEHFSAASIPGFAAEPTLGRYRGYVQLTTPALAVQTRRGEFTGHQGTYQLAFEADRDHDLHTYNFNRIEVEAQQMLAGFRPGHRLTLHSVVAVTNADGVVPYYLMYTLGGGGGLAAFRPDTIGTDGTKATLRSYQNYRFRDRNIFLAQAEYRVPVHGPVDATVFYDLGRVAPRAGDLFQDLKQGTGFSISYMHNGTTLGRLDVGFGSGEGPHLFWSFGLLP